MAQPSSARRRIAAVALLLIVTVFCLYQFLPEESLLPGAQVDRVVVQKASRTMTLYQNGRALKAYKISLGKEPIGPKARAGDGRTPEGNYALDFRNTQSRFHKSLHISYPSAADRAAAQQLGANPGGDIMIHGLQNGLGWIGRFHRFWDWTDGCIAVTNSEIEEIWRSVRDGTPIEIYP